MLHRGYSEEIEDWVEGSLLLLDEVPYIGVVDNKTYDKFLSLNPTMIRKEKVPTMIIGALTPLVNWYKVDTKSVSTLILNSENMEIFTNDLVEIEVDSKVYSGCLLYSRDRVSIDLVSDDQSIPLNQIVSDIRKCKIKVLGNRYEEVKD